MSNEKLVFEKRIFRTDTLDDVFQYKVSRFVYENVCYTCNNGWMSQLEDAVTPCLQQIWNTKDIRVLLDESNRLTFSRWAIKSACVFDRLLEMREIDPSIPRQLQADQSSVPGGVSVFVGWHPVQFPNYISTVQKNA